LAIITVLKADIETQLCPDFARSASYSGQERCERPWGEGQCDLVVL